MTDATNDATTIDNEREQRGIRLVAMARSRRVPSRLARLLAEDRVGVGPGLRPTRAYVHAGQWLELDATVRSWHGLLLRGPTGVGKTLAACSVVCRPRYSFDVEPHPECLGRGATVYSQFESTPGAMFVTAIELGRMLMACNLGRRMDSVLAWAVHCPVVVVDDLGREANDGSGHVSSGLFNFVASRFDRDQRTIVTTNLEDDEFRSRYGAALQDRFRAHGVVSNLSDADYQRSAR